MIHAFSLRFCSQPFPGSRCNAYPQADTLQAQPFIHLPTFMASPVVADYPGSKLTQAQNGVNLPLTNPDVQGYAIRLSSECISTRSQEDLADGISYPFFEYRFYRTFMCR